MDHFTQPSSVPAICPQCGAQLQADPARDAEICRYCGAPFSVERAAQLYRERYFGAQAPEQPPAQTSAQSRQAPAATAPSAEPGPRDLRPPQDLRPPRTSKPEKPRKRHTFWWLMGWLFVFPVPLTILMLRNRRMSANMRGFIIVLGWIVYLLLGLTYYKQDAPVQRQVTTIYYTAPPLSRPEAPARPGAPRLPIPPRPRRRPGRPLRSPRRSPRRNPRRNLRRRRQPLRRWKGRRVLCPMA